MLAFLLVLGFSLFFLGWIRVLPFFELTSIPKKWLYAIFLVKVLAALAYVFIHDHFYAGGDARNYFEGGLIIADLIKENPIGYLRLVFGPNGGFIDPKLFPTTYACGYWENSGDYFMLRFHAVTRLFSFGEYYVHAVFMAFTALVGTIIWAKLLSAFKILSPITLLVLALWPSGLFWFSGMHKDGFLFLFTGIALLSSVAVSKKNFMALFGLGFSLLALFIIRKPYFLVFVPCWMTYLAMLCMPKKRWIAPTVFLLSMLSFILLNAILQNGLLEYLALKQGLFQRLIGSSDFSIPVLEATYASLFRNLPLAFVNALTRPWIWETSNPLAVLSSLEFLTIIGLLFFAILKGVKRSLTAIDAFLLSFSLLYLTFTGLVIGNAGALVRYRTFSMLFLALFILSFISLSRKKKPTQ